MVYSSRWIFGVALGAVGSILLSLGLNIEKLALSKKSNNDLKAAVVSSGRKRYLFLWLIGFFIFVLGNGLSVIALAYAPASCVAPLGCLSIASNVISANMILGEKVYQRDYVSTTLITSGALAIVVSSRTQSADKNYSVARMYELFTAKAFCAVFLIFLLFVITMYVVATGHLHKSESIIINDKRSHHAQVPML